VAEACGVNDGNFSRKLRKELPQEEKQNILEIIDRLAAGEEICKPVRKRRKPMTNADRIRDMTDEELAVFLRDVEYDVEQYPFVQDWDKWLKQPAEEDNDENRNNQDQG
jgi:hypothetical protein